MHNYITKVTICLWLSICIIPLKILAQEKPYREPDGLNNWYVELGGAAFLYSLNYEKILYKSTSLGWVGRVGVSYSFSDGRLLNKIDMDKGAVLAPFTTSFLLGSRERKEKIELGIGFTLINKSVFWFPATAIRTEVLKNNFLPDSLTALDWYIWILACTQGEVELIEAEIIKYRQHADKEQNSFLEENWEIDALLMFSYAINKGAVCEWLKLKDFQAIQEFVEQLAKNSAGENFSFQHKMKYLMLFQEINKSFDLKILLKDLNFKFIKEMDPRFKQSLLGLGTAIEDFESLFWSVGIDFKSNSKSKKKSNFIELVPNHDGFDLIKNQLGIESSTKIPKRDELVYQLFSEYNDALRSLREAELNKQITKFELKVVGVIRAIKNLKNRRYIFKK
jgi:hypothetical protein